VLGVPTTFIREARRRVSRDEAAKPSQSFSKTRRHPFAKRTRLRLLSLNYGRENPKRTRSTQVLDLLAEDNRLNVYAGKLEVRPPGAPTTQRMKGQVAYRVQLSQFSD
jgi:hypothetical protein